MLLSKLLAILSTAKGAAAATVVVAAAVGTGVAATNADVQNAVTTSVQSVTHGTDAKASNQPAVVDSRNDADKKLRDAFHINQLKLAKLHSTHVDNTDRAKLDDTVNIADAALRARLSKAIDDVAAITLGREGLESPKPTGSPDIKAPFTAATQAKIDDIVKTAIADMDKIEKNAEDTVALLPTAPAGKPADVGKPATAPTPAAHPTP